MDRDSGLDPTKWVEGKDIPEDFDWKTIPEHLFRKGIRDVFKRDTQVICDHADIIYLIDNVTWRNSKGANAEVALATALGLMLMQAL